MKRITIDPITRLEGHGKIEIFLNDEGDVKNVYFQVPELSWPYDTHSAVVRVFRSRPLVPRLAAVAAGIAVVFGLGVEYGKRSAQPVATHWACPPM